jgi:hypothetical protein
LFQETFYVKGDLVGCRGFNTEFVLHTTFDKEKAVAKLLQPFEDLTSQRADTTAANEEVAAWI